MVELKRRLRLVPSSGTTDDPYADSHLYMGVSGTRGMLAVHPELEKFASENLHTEFKGAEARRKAHEERKLAKGLGKGKKEE